MKNNCLFALLFLTGCSTTPKLGLLPLAPPNVADNESIRYPETLQAYHVGRYADPNNDQVLHEQHTVYRVEENTRWNFHPGPAGGSIPTLPSAQDAAFNPTPVNDAILAEVNSQRIATAQITAQARTLVNILAQVQAGLAETKTNLQATAALRSVLSELKLRLDALEAREDSASQTVRTNAPADALSP